MMDKEVMIEMLVERELAMFRVVNGDEHTNCQNNPNAFRAMRRAQFLAWSDATIESYLDDLETAAGTRNLLREKYIRMMRSTDPVSYAKLVKELPPLTEEKKTLVEEIWDLMLEQTEKLRAEFPALAYGGRPLHAADEYDGLTSIETYQTSELYTYSEKTLQLLLEHIKKLKKDNIDIVYEIQRNSLACMGFSTIADAAQVLERQHAENKKPQNSQCSCSVN